MGCKAAKAGTKDNAIFQLYSRGLATSRDAYLYNFSREACAHNGQRVVDEYLSALRQWNAPNGGDADLDVIVDHHSSGVRWDRELKNNLRRRKATSYSENNTWVMPYPPFIKQHRYVDYTLANNKYQIDKIFPSPDIDNRAICVPGIGSTKPFSALMVDAMPDLEVISKSQCFPRYRYTNPYDGEPDLLDDPPPLERIDNISDTALATFREHYSDDTITKDAIYDYVYGVLHAPDFRERFATAFSKELLRIPMAPDFRAFAEAGRAFTELHINYETCDEYPLTTELKPDNPQTEYFLIGTRKMRFSGNDNGTLIVNDHVRLSGIPAEAHHYVVNGRTPLEWFIDRYRVITDKHSGIVNDPNGWFEESRDLISAIRRIVQTSVETVRIINNLAKALDI